VRKRHSVPGTRNHSLASRNGARSRERAWLSMKYLGYRRRNGVPQRGRGRARRRPRIRVPALAVTLIGIALTAWLLPALTRQWDDRQKAHDVKAAIVADMASATAHALTLGQAVTSKSAQPTSRLRRDDWLLASVEIEARLRAYFSPRVVAAWQVYSYFVDGVVGVDDVQAQTRLRRVIDWMYAPDANGYRDLFTAKPRERLDPRVSGAVRLAIAYAKNRVQSTSIPFGPALKRGLSHDGRSPDIDAEVRFVESSESDTGLEAQLVTFEETLATSALRSHMTAYSTSAGDYFRDLVP
jgi:hypothetical protein